MVISRSNEKSVMDLRVIALYPCRISAISGRPGVRFRRRKKHESTLIPCRVETIEGKSVAAPEYPVPEGTPAPRYRAQFETLRLPIDGRRIVYVVLSAEPDASRMDPEHTLLSPIFDDGYRLIFEFQRAHILSVNRLGAIETRLVAVHPVFGVVGTKTIHRFNTRLSALAARCTEHLVGAVDLFPRRERPPRACRIQIPVGEANLTFTAGARSHGRLDVERAPQDDR